MKKATLLLGAGAALAFAIGFSTPAGAGAAQNTDKMVYVDIIRVRQTDNLDKDIDEVKIAPDRADFFAKIMIGGLESRTKVMSQDDGRPYWRVTRSVSGNRVFIRIKLFDEDGGLSGADDRCDINPRASRKDLMLTYNLATGRIRGDASGRRGRIIHSRGVRDSDKAEIWFMVNHR